MPTRGRAVIVSPRGRRSVPLAGFFLARVLSAAPAKGLRPAIGGLFFALVVDFFGNSAMRQIPEPKTVMPDQTAGLRSIDVDGLQRVFGDELAGHEVDASRPWCGDRRHARRADRRVMLDARRLTNAVEHIGRLPEPGETFHLVTAKSYSLWHVIRAAVRLAVPTSIAYLGIATLGFSRQNLEDLLGLLDAGQIGKVDFLYSVYFASNEKEICQRLTHELTTRGHRVVAMLTHAKVLLMELTDGRSYVVESSANLRSCSSIEQITLTHDRALFDFHRLWIGDIMEAGR
jgi:hypothetical protein